MHVHVSALSTLIVAAQLVLVLAGFLFISTTWPDSAFGKAFGVLTNG